MSSKVDMSLEEIIKCNRKSGGARVFKDGNGGAKPQRFRGGRGRHQSRGHAPKLYVRPGLVPDVWRQSLYEGVRRSRGGGATRVGPGPRISQRVDLGTLLLSNLDFSVQDSDIKELFEEFGALRKSAIHYDKSGRSLGTAEVVFEHSLDASKAMKQYNNVPLDGKPMKITIVGGEESRLERTKSSYLYAGPGTVRQPRDGSREISQGNGVRGGGSEKGANGGSGRGGELRGADDRDGKRSGGGEYRGTGSENKKRSGDGGRKEAVGKNGRSAGGRGRGRGSRRDGRGSFNGACKAISKEDLDAQLDAYNQGRNETN